MKTISKSLSISFVIIGTVLGAGFLSGKEIYEFIDGQDILLSSFFIFLLFSLITSFLLSTELKQTPIYKISYFIFFFGNLVITCGMLSAVDSLFTIIFPWSKGTMIFPIITIIFSNVVMFGGTKSLKNVNTFLVPLIILVIILFVFIPYDNVVIKNGKINPIKLSSYVGLNMFLAIPVISNLGKKESKRVIILASIISALVLSLLVFMIHTTIVGNSLKVLNSDLPILQILSNNKFLYICYILVLYFGIITTLLSAHYPLFYTFKDTFYGNFCRVILTVLCVVLSRIGFHNIISKVYPVLGIVGLCFIVIFAVYLLFSRKKRQQDTLKPLKDRV